MKTKEFRKKLSLNRETLRNLNDRELLDVAGGGTTGCSGTSSGSGCTNTLISDCHCPSDNCTANCTANC